MIRERRQLTVFLGLTFFLVLVLALRSVLSYRSQAPFRAAWSDVLDTLEDQQSRIDALAGELADFDARVEDGERELQRLGGDIATWERRATNGRLPTPEYRRYQAAIRNHNEFVEEHNTNILDMRRVYERYSALVDTHNVWVDSANTLQRTAVEEGIQLPPRGRTR